jgi:DNA-binding response OmpR family regulator
VADQGTGTTVVIASDADWVADDLGAVLDANTQVIRVRAGVDVLPAVQDHDPDLVVLDLQIGNMGGMAACLELRLEAGAGRLALGPILMLLDREADVFLARRCEAEGWLVKPLDAFRLRKAVTALLAGDTYREHTAVAAG